MLKREVLKKIKRFDFAHRGLYDNSKAPENSLLAFKRAVEWGFGIELDVHLTKDKRLVVVHDSNLKRVCGVDKDIEDITFEESRDYPLLNTSELIPEFKDVLKIVKGKVPLLVELKVVKNGPELCEATLKELEKYKGEYIIESFFPFALRYLYKHYPDIITGQLAGDLIEKNKASETEVNKFENFMMKNLFVNLISRPYFIAFKYESIDRFEFRQFSGPKFAWTIRTYNDYLKCKKKGIIPIFEKFNPKEI